MKHIILLLVSAFVIGDEAQAQNYFTKNGMVSFFSKTPLENISAVNNEVVSVLNAATGETKFSVIIKSFKFKKALMQEHFNENYMESEKYPKATFSGAITDISKVAFTKDGKYNVTTTGNLTMHGVTKKITAPTTIMVKDRALTGTSSFVVLLADYNISIPRIVESNISKSLEIQVNCSYQQK